MPAYQIRTVPTDDGEVSVEIWEDDRALAHVKYDAAGLDSVIAALAKARAQMRDEVPLELDPNARVEAIALPAWRIPRADSHGCRVLALRHPGLGWISFLIDPGQAAEMAQWLAFRPPEPQAE